MPKRYRSVLATAVLGFALATLGVLGVPAGPAAPMPATPVDYPEGASATRASGLGFDACAAPPISALRAWTDISPYTTVNMYIGGVNRACEQPNLDAEWVREASALGWRLLPTFVGYQSSCMPARSPEKFNVTTATQRGIADAQDAVARAEELGLLQGSALYANLENYRHTDPSCARAVQRYVTAWTETLHDEGYLSGVYVHHASGLRDLVASYGSADHTRPDAVWMADWDRDRSLGGWPNTPDTFWAVWQRIKQFRGDHDETWGGITLNIDSNSLRAPVATVAYPFTVTSVASLEARSGPSTSYPVVRTHPPESSLAVVCQTRGQQVATSPVWNRLASGAWVPDYYVSTPSDTGFGAVVPRCTYPGQVTAPSGLNARTGPGESYPVEGEPLPRGSLAWVVCQETGSKVATTMIWNQLRDGRWVSDYYVANESNTTLSPPIPRCP